jgi:hypothetical protein
VNGVESRGPRAGAVHHADSEGDLPGAPTRSGAGTNGTSIAVCSEGRFFWGFKEIFQEHQPEAVREPMAHLLLFVPKADFVGDFASAAAAHQKQAILEQENH